MQILLQPVELRLAELAHAFQLHHVDQADEVHAFVVEAVPAISLRAFAVALEIQLSVVDGGVVFAGHVEDLAARSENLIERVELRGLGGMRQVAGVDQEIRSCGSGIDLAQCSLERGSDVGVRWLVEADVAVADLDEGEVGLCGRLHRLAERA